MKRRQLFEFEDQRWLPASWRHDLIDYLQRQIVAARIYAPAIPKLAAALAASGQDRIVDLGSGPGITVAAVAAWLRDAGWRGQVTCTDLFPPTPVRHRRYHPRPVDAAAVPAELPGFRTLFTVFHHFAPATARAVLAQAVADQVPIAVFEFTRRRATNVLGMLLSPLVMWGAIFRLKPPSAQRLFWTYAIPVLPLLYWWDGTVSHLRTYRVDELRSLADATGGTFAWEVGTIDARTYPLTYLIGLPRNDGTPFSPPVW